MTKSELIDLCLTFPDCYEDYPFTKKSDRHGDAEWAAMRHKSNRKTFAFVYLRGERPFVNLKCEPMKADFLRSMHGDFVRPGYHMNKQHWNTVLLLEDLPEPLLMEMLTDSYNLTRGSIQKRGAR